MFLAFLQAITKCSCFLVEREKNDQPSTYYHRGRIVVASHLQLVSFAILLVIIANNAVQ